MHESDRRQIVRDFTQLLAKAEFRAAWFLDALKNVLPVCGACRQRLHSICLDEAGGNEGEGLIEGFVAPSTRE